MTCEVMCDMMEIAARAQAESSSFQNEGTKKHLGLSNAECIKQPAITCRSLCETVKATQTMVETWDQRNGSARSSLCGNSTSTVDCIDLCISVSKCKYLRQALGPPVCYLTAVT